MKQDLAEKGAWVLKEPTPEAALRELCAGTCDTRADCENRTTHFCDKEHITDRVEYGWNSRQVFQWGECQPCPGVEGGVPCSGNGECNDQGKCRCNKGWLGDDCNVKSAEHFKKECVAGFFYCREGEQCPGGREQCTCSNKRVYV